MLISEFVYIYLPTSLTQVRLKSLKFPFLSLVNFVRFTLIIRKVIVSPFWISYFCNVRFSITKVVVQYLAVFKTNRIAKLSSNPCKFFMGKLIKCMPKYYRNHNYIQLVLCQAEDPTCTTAHFRVCLYIFSNSFSSQTKTLQCPPFFIRDFQCLLFETTKVCSVCYLRLMLLSKIKFWWCDNTILLSGHKIFFFFVKLAGS